MNWPHKAILILAENPHPPNSRSFEGYEDLFRLRVGDWRIVYQIDMDIAKITISIFPKRNVDDVVVQGNRVVQVWHAHATHRGPLMNIPSTGLRIEVRGTSVLTFRGDKLYRALYVWDVAGLLRAIGLLPEL